jgi:hypothetical protein
MNSAFLFQLRVLYFDIVRFKYQLVHRKDMDRPEHTTRTSSQADEIFNQTSKKLASGVRLWDLRN